MRDSTYGSLQKAAARMAMDGAGGVGVGLDSSISGINAFLSTSLSSSVVGSVGATSVHTASGQSLFEIHIQRARSVSRAG